MLFRFNGEILFMQFINFRIVFSFKYERKKISIIRMHLFAGGKSENFHFSLYHVLLFQFY